MRRSSENITPDLSGWYGRLPKTREGCFLAGFFSGITIATSLVAILVGILK